MSVEILEALKEQSERLSPVEKRLLADYLILGIEKTDETDLGLPDVRKDEKRRLRDKWMRENREKYGGLYVALDGDKLLGTGRNFPEAAHWARIAGIKDAFIDFLPPVDYVGEMGGW
jgi:hypothetical protein